MRYKHTQIGYVTGAALGIGALASYASVRSESGERGWGELLATGGLLVGAALFSSLTVIVDEEELRFYFGPGFWTRRIALDDIVRVEVVQNSPLYGWGIRYTPHGWLYNVSGLRAVELTLEGEGPLRIGTDEPEALKRALEEARTTA